MKAAKLLLSLLSSRIAPKRYFILSYVSLCLCTCLCIYIICQYK